MAAQLNLSPRDLILVHNDELRTTSLKVAEAFGKLHKDVLRKIESLGCSSEFSSAHFCAHVENQQVGTARRDMKYYEMTKDGFMFLVMGFTGEKAAQVKEAYISAFNWMAARLRGQQAAAPVPVSASGPLVFNGVPVMGTAQMCVFFSCDRGLFKSNLDHFAGRFQLGVHYFKLSGDALHSFALENLHTGLIGRRHGREFLIWSYDGVREQARCLPERYTRDWERRWQCYVESGQLAEVPAVVDAEPVQEVLQPMLPLTLADSPPLQATGSFTPRQVAINAIDLSMGFVKDEVQIVASTVERLIMHADPDSAGLCRMLYLRCSEMHNILDCMRSDLG